MKSPGLNGGHPRFKALEEAQQPRPPVDIRTASSIEELMPDEDRREAALDALEAVVKHADDLYPLHALPDVSAPLHKQPRYLDVLREMSNGHDRKSAAKQLGIGQQTVMTHLKRARQALGAKTTAHAIAEAIRRGDIE